MEKMFDNIFYYYIPVVLDINEDCDDLGLDISSEYLRSNVKIILDKIRVRKLNDISVIKNMNFNIKIDFSYDSEAELICFPNLDNKEEYKYSKIKYLRIKTIFDVKNEKMDEYFDSLVKINADFFQALKKMTDLTKENGIVKLLNDNLKIKGDIKIYDPRVASSLFVIDEANSNKELKIETTNKLSNCLTTKVVKVKDEWIYDEAIYSTNIRGLNYIRSTNKLKDRFKESFSTNYNYLFLIALNQAIICEYENEKITLKIQEYDDKNSNINYKEKRDSIKNDIMHVKKQIATYFFDVTTNVYNLNMIYVDLIKNFVISVSQAELLENLSILDYLLEDDVKRIDKKYAYIGRIVNAALTIILLILAILQVVEEKLLTFLISLGAGVILLICYILYNHFSEK